MLEFTMLVSFALVCLFGSTKLYISGVNAPYEWTVWPLV